MGLELGGESNYKTTSKEHINEYYFESPDFIRITDLNDDEAVVINVGELRRMYQNAKELGWL